VSAAVKCLPCKAAVQVTTKETTTPQLTESKKSNWLCGMCRIAGLSADKCRERHPNLKAEIDARQAAKKNKSSATQNEPVLVNDAVQPVVPITPATPQNPRSQNSPWQVPKSNLRRPHCL
jgi:hypothetical protein